MQYHFQSGRYQSSPRWEKGAIILAVVLFAAGIVGYFFDRQHERIEQPVQAGTYTEGVLADSPTKAERIVAQLTNIGLTYRDEDDSIKPGLAESWSVSEDAKTYTFILRDGFDATGLLTTIQSSKTSWTGITVTAPAANSLQFVLPEPLNGFLATTTDPLFPFGPYEVVKRDKKEVVLRSNKQFVLGESYIPKFIVRNYDSHDELAKAARDGEINGSADLIADNAPKKFKEFVVEFPRYQVLWFNVQRPAFKNVADRQRIIKAESGQAVTYSLLANQIGTGSDLADSLARRLAGQGVTLNVVKKTSVELQKEVIPKRDFDLILYGINYGIERDYYPFWHSSQASPPGLNISGVKDKELDKLLEAARREQDHGKRGELNKQIEDYLEKNGLQHILGQEKFSFWIDKEIKGVSYGTIDESSDRFSLVWRWYSKSKWVKAS